MQSTNQYAELNSNTSIIMLENGDVLFHYFDNM